MKRRLSQKQFDNLPTLDKDAINNLANDLEKSYSVICVSTTRTENGDAIFQIIYEGDEVLLFNSALALFRSNDRVTEILNQAYLEVLHERTVASY